MTLRPMYSGMIAGVAAVALFAGGALAQDRQPGPDRGPRGMDFATVDADGNGEVTQDEMRAQAEARFARSDTDGDGVVTRDEMIARMQARQAERFGRIADRMIERSDDDGDGAVSLSEMMPPERTQARMFKRLDKDGSGTISQEEFAEMRQMREGRGHGKGPRRWHEGGRWHGKGHGEGRDRERGRSAIEDAPSPEAGGQAPAQD